MVGVYFVSFSCFTFQEKTRKLFFVYLNLGNPNSMLLDLVGYGSWRDSKEVAELLPCFSPALRGQMALYPRFMPCVSATCAAYIGIHAFFTIEFSVLEGINYVKYLLSYNVERERRESKWICTHRVLQASGSVHTAYSKQVDLYI